jgi:hypothetical protein
MITILNRYRLRREATARRVSAESAFSSPRLLLPLLISPLPSIAQPERDEALVHHAFPSRTTLSLANLPHRPYPSPQASTPRNLNLFRWDSFVFAREFSRDHGHGLAGYLLDALGVKVNIESLSICAPNMMGDDPKGGPLQIIFLCHIKTRAVLRVHICARREVGEWVLGVVEALWNEQPSLPNDRHDRTRAGPKDHQKTGQTSHPKNQRSSAELHELKWLRSVPHNLAYIRNRTRPV